MLFFVAACSRETVQQREAEAVAAAFRHYALTSPSFHNYTVATWFLARQGAFDKATGIADWFRNPPAEWVQSLQPNTPPVYPVSAARMEPNPAGISDRTGNHAVAVFTVRSIAWPTDSTGVVEVEVCGRFYVGGGLRFRVVREHGIWRVLEMKHTYVT